MYLPLIPLKLLSQGEKKNYRRPFKKYSSILSEVAFFLNILVEGILSFGLCKHTQSFLKANSPLRESERNCLTKTHSPFQPRSTRQQTLKKKPI